MSEYSEFFLNSPSTVVQLETLEISHPHFTKTYRVVRNATQGVTVDVEGYGHNLFDPDDLDVEPDFFVNHLTGALQANVLYTATGFVPVAPGRTYTLSYSHARAFYDAEGNFLSGTNSFNPATFTTPAGAYLARFTMSKASVATFQVEEGDTATPFKAFGLADFEYYPLRITNVGVRNDLDFGVQIDLGDLGEVLPLEVDAVSDADGFDLQPTVVYRTYRSDDLGSPLFGPLLLSVSSFSFTREGSTFEAKAPTISVSSVGELYKLDRFPMLRGFL